jgi:ATP-dependent DNA helicase RecG
MLTLQTPLKRLYGVGDKVAEKLSILGLETVQDLLAYYPRRYEDYSNPRTIDQLIPGESHIIQARIMSIENDTSPRQRMKLTKAVVVDATGRVNITWFNQPFLIRTLKEGVTYLFAGKVEKDFKGNMTMLSPDIERDGKILAVYSETAGLTSKFLRKLFHEIAQFIAHMPDWLPEETRIAEGLVTLGDAYKMMHFPDSVEQISLAKRRLAFNELFLLLSQVHQSKKELRISPAPACNVDQATINTFISSLPFTLTDSQQQASQEIIADITTSSPMNRLLEGDVGSGKTAVGAIAAYVTAQSGYRSIWMAPTEILANQHYATCERFLGPFGIRVGLLTGSTSKKMKDQLDDYDLIIGTQALIQDTVTIIKLGLIIVDEQHRFGVKQRAKFMDLKNQEKLVPHFLAMTATPIPRTLALTIYGDLDISQLSTVPTGRKPILSRFIAPTQRRQAYEFIRQQIKEGRQAFVVCPLIEDTAKVGQLDLGLEEKRAVLAEYEKLSNHIFPELRVGLLHGKLKSKDKEAVMTAFRDRELDILVSTAVIEVGIDIPNASVMMIEGAERFGLAQLHQFRGRVGRGEHQAYCFVFTDSNNPAAFERLKAFTQTTSGFDLAELDLQLRGPGQLAGLQQSGIGDLKIARLSDIDMIQRVKKVVEQVFAEGVDQYPDLVAQLTGSTSSTIH